MSKITLTGNASGTGVVTLTSPNTNTNRTITLPDATATIATQENFTSTGIDDNATSTAITIDSGENVELANALTVPSTVHLTGSDHRIVTGTDTGRAIFSNATTSAYMSLHGANFSSNPNAVLFNAPGGVVANSCNLIMSNGFGIDFSADGNASGMTSEVLDDYETGTWTPVLTFGGASAGITYSLQSGIYTKVGDLVTVLARINLSSKGTSVGIVAIAGLPFTVSSTVIPVPSFRPHLVTFADMLIGYANGTNIYLEEITNAGSITDIYNTDFVNTSQITATLTYKV